MSPPSKTPIKDVHPQVRAMLDAAQACGAKPWNELSVEDARAVYRKGALASRGDLAACSEVRDFVMASKQGDIPGRLYRPLELTSEGCLVYFHGGVFVVGDLDTHEASCRNLAQACGMAVVSVDYRLAPEHAYPAAIEDALAAVQWVYDNAEPLGLNGDQILVGGDSAGGTLATVVACESAVPIAGQVLLYPAVDAAMDTPSYKTYATGYRLTAPIMRWGYEHWFAGKDLIEQPRVSPLRYHDVGRMPPAIIVLAGMDPLVDEGLLYAARLRRCGVRVDLQVYQDMVHAFVNAPGLIDCAHDATAWIAERVKNLVT